MAGAQYIAQVRDTLSDLSRHAPIGAIADVSAAAAAADAVVQSVWRAESDLGDGMKATPLAEAYIKRLQAAFEKPVDTTRRAACVEAAQALIVRVGNQSNLILDPDLNSYYTMSLVVLRYPELHALIGRMAGRRPEAMDSTPDARHVDSVLLQGRFDAAVAVTRSDAAEAMAAGDASLQAALTASRDSLDRALAPLVRQSTGEPAPIDAYAAADLAVFDAWRAADDQLQRLLAERIDLLRHRMWLHLGTAVALLAAILAVVYSVATSISRPLTRLASVAGRISESSDYSVRAPSSGGGEMGLLETSFNRMLGDLARDRDVRQELVATTRAEAAQRTLVEAFPTPLFVTSIPDHRVLHANPPAAPWLDGLHTDPWVTCLDPAARMRYFQRLSDVGSVDGFEVLWRTREGYQWALLSARRLLYRGEDALLTTITPITQIKLLEQRLELWSKVFEASSEGIVILDADRRLLSVNQSFSRVTGWESTEVIGRTLDFLYCDRHEDSFYVTLWAAMILRGAWRGEVWFKRKGGEPFPSWLVANAVRDHEGQVTHFVLAASDISDHKASEERIAHMAHHDVLTDLPNRALCLERLRLAMQQAARDGTAVAVVYIDLDRFKRVNDTLGHHVGDALLRSVAKRLTQAVRNGDTVCRLGGDEFLLVLSRVSGADEARSVVVDRVFTAMGRPHDLESGDVDMSFSAGVAVFPHDGRDVDHLVRNADTAMYHAKAAGRNQAVFYSSELHAQAEQRQSIERSLRHAVERGELYLHYQPRVDARSLRVLGVEALARWRSAAHGDVSPAEFMPIADESGLIVPIGAWLLDQACAQHRTWLRDGTGHMPVSFNLSSAQLHDPGLVDLIAGALERHGMDPGSLEIELSESLLMDDAITTVAILNRVRKLGVRMSIDDFGTGFSSLHFLHQFPIDKLKIDVSFVRDMASDPTHLAVIRAVIGLGHSLKLKVLAEGVELLDAQRLLTEAGCDELQGFLYSEPMPGVAFPGWLANHGTQVAAADDGLLGLPAPAGHPVPGREAPRQLTHG